MSADADVDVIIVGAGPAGLAAAAVLAAHQVSVCLIDEQIGPGGQIWRNTNPSHQWPGVACHTASTIIDVDAGTSAVAAADKDSHQPQSINVTWLQYADGRRIMRQTRAHALIIATGAMERPLLFPGAHLPGVMGVGAVQSVLKQARLVPRGQGVVLAGQGPLLLLTLQQLIAQGASIDAVLDLTQPGARRRAAMWLPGALAADSALLYQGLQLLRALHRVALPGKRKIPVFNDITALQAVGENHLQAVQFVTDGQERRLPARLLAVHDGVLPNTQLTRLLNLEHRWDDRQQSFAPWTQADGRSSHAHIWVTGDGAGIAGADLAVQRGRLTGLTVVQALGSSSSAHSVQHFTARAHHLERSINRRLPARDFIDTLYRPLPVDHLATDDTIVCRCEAITLGAVRHAIARGAIGPNRVKTFTRCGMGACQGRQCGNALTRIVAQETGRHVDEVGALRIRPPLKPTLIADYLGVDNSNTENAGDTPLDAMA